YIYIYRSNSYTHTHTPALETLSSESSSLRNFVAHYKGRALVQDDEYAVMSNLTSGFNPGTACVSISHCT
ncbi:MAG: hypothetical protein ACK56I_12965, partial [bacterium]